MDTVIAQVKSVLISTPKHWQILVDSYPGDQLRQAPAPNEWSALGCLQHLIDAERNVFPARLQAFLSGQDFPVFNPARERAKPAAADPVDMAAEFEQLRAESLAILNRVKPEDLSRTAQHPQYGLVPLEQVLQEWAAHDLNHTVQAVRALMQPYIQGSGPWRPLFKDHDVEVSQGHGSA